MRNISILVKSLTIFSNLADDRLIKAFSGLSDKKIKKAVKAYSDICRILAETDKTVSDYIFSLCRYDDNFFMEACAGGKKLPDGLLQCVRYDMDVISYIAEIDSVTAKKYLAEKHKKNSGFIYGLPDFSAGSVKITLEVLEETAKKCGVGIFARNSAFMYDIKEGLIPVEHPDPIRLSDLKRYEKQREKVVQNTLCFLEGKPANNVLLYGDRGTGKSSTVKAVLNEYKDRGLRLIQTDKKSLSELGKLIEKIASLPQRFLIFIDDLSFNEDDKSFSVLKAVLEGSVISRPDNVLIYVTSNRRHLVNETFSSRSGDDIHRTDTIHEMMSLSDRFGLTITFTSPNKNDFCEIVREMAEDRHMSGDIDKLIAGAERFALEKGGRSPRVARQYIDHVCSRIELGFEKF